MQKQKYHELETRLIDHMELSPIQTYIKYKEFPWASVMTLCLVFVTTLRVQSDTLGRRVQERNIHIFFNYHILQHQNFDIYEDDDVFTFRTQQYKDFRDVKQFFNRTLEVVSNMNEYNFYESNQTQIDNVNHTILKYFNNKSRQPEVIKMSLVEMVKSQSFALELKEFLTDVKRMEMVFHLNNMTTNLKSIDLLITIDILQKFQVDVQVDVKFINETFTQTDRIQEKKQQDNLKVRKIPPHHHEKYAPYNIAYFFRLILILLSFHEGIKRVIIYRKHPFAIRGISEGQTWQKLSFAGKCKLMGWWNITIIILNIVGLSAQGLSVFTAWIQLVRYIQYTQNPYIITFLGKNILRIMLIVILSAFFVITGFVLFSMVKFSYIQKFQRPELSYFSYVFNNFQYGIYENFIDIGRYGGFYQFLYFIFCFYMVWCTNNIVPSIICNTVINKNRLKYLTKFFKQIRIPCPVCSHITNQEAQRAVKRTYGMLSVFNAHAKESQVQMQIQSPKILPFLSPKLLPASKTKIRTQTQEEDRPKRTKFQIRQELNIKLDISSMQLYRQKIQLMRKKIEESLLQLDIFEDRGFNKFIKQKLKQTNDKVNLFKIKIEKKRTAQQEKSDLKKAIQSSKKTNKNEDASQKKQ